MFTRATCHRMGVVRVLSIQIVHDVPINKPFVRMVGWCLTALSAQKGYIVTCEK